MFSAEWLRANFESLQYLAFFGVLAAIAVLEFVIPVVAVNKTRQRRWPANYGLTVLNIFVVSAIPVSGLFAADMAQAQGMGLLNMIGVGGALAVIAGLLLRSLTSYAVHVLMHKVPVLWRLHRVHHSDTDFDVSTAVRFHPLEFLVQVPIGLTMIWLMGIPPIAIVLYELLDAAMAVWTHANVRLPSWLERPLRLVLVTPDMHRIHHSSLPTETDSNYGATFSLWDRLFGTMRKKTGAELAATQVGLSECQDQRSRSLLWLLWLPFIRLLALERKERQS
jgi:sterol desaturase/sphingolipid hydroxylase (fatty acid hydroxylase superfamily)